MNQPDIYCIGNPKALVGLTDDLSPRVKMIHEVDDVPSGGGIT